MALQVINTAKQAGGNRPLKVQTAQEVQAANRLLQKITFKYATVVIELDGELWACKMDMARLLQGLSISGKRAKVNCPFGKKQVQQMIEDADALELIGTSEDLQKYYDNPRYKGVTNDGQAVEYLLAQKYRCKFDHYGSMSTNGGEFRGTEVKFFSFDKTTGTPSATIERI